MGKLDKLELENEHIAEEMVEHLILEKVGALPDHGHAKGIKLKKKVKKNKKSNRTYNFEFFSITLFIVLGELWYLGDYLLEEYPFISSFFHLS